MGEVAGRRRASLDFVDLRLTLEDKPPINDCWLTSLLWLPPVLMPTSVDWLPLPEGVLSRGCGRCCCWRFLCSLAETGMTTLSAAKLNLENLGVST